MVLVWVAVSDLAVRPGWPWGLGRALLWLLVGFLSSPWEKVRWGDVHINDATDYLRPWIQALVLFVIPNIPCFYFNAFIVFEAILEPTKLV